MAKGHSVVLHSSTILTHHIASDQRFSFGFANHQARPRFVPDVDQYGMPTASSMVGLDHLFNDIVRDLAQYPTEATLNFQIYGLLLGKSFGIGQPYSALALGQPPPTSQLFISQL